MQCVNVLQCYCSVLMPRPKLLILNSSVGGTPHLSFCARTNWFSWSSSLRPLIMIIATNNRAMIIETNETTDQIMIFVTDNHTMIIETNDHIFWQVITSCIFANNGHDYCIQLSWLLQSMNMIIKSINGDNLTCLFSIQILAALTFCAEINGFFHVSCNDDNLMPVVWHLCAIFWSVES